MGIHKFNIIRENVLPGNFPSSYRYDTCCSDTEGNLQHLTNTSSPVLQPCYPPQQYLYYISGTWLSLRTWPFSLHPLSSITLLTEYFFP